MFNAGDLGSFWPFVPGLVSYPLIGGVVAACAAVAFKWVCFQARLLLDDFEGQ